MAYDSVRGRVVLFCVVGNPARSETWEWDGSMWTHRFPSTSPQPRDGAVMAFDSARGETVLFGGTASNPSTIYFSDTWAWDGNNWTRRTPGSSPSARVANALTYDSIRGRIVLFGGGDGGSALLNDTWDWDGTTWVQRATVPPTPPRGSSVMTFDPVRDRLVLFGGRDSSGVFLWDTWEASVVGNATYWTLRNAASNSGARTKSMVFDEARQRSVLWAWDHVLGSVATWEWDGSVWVRQQTTTVPSGNIHPGMAYDSAQDVSVLFLRYWAGSAWVPETWEGTSARPARHTAYGSGCAGSAGVPQLAAQLYARPWLADTFGLQLTNLPNSAPGLLLLGTSRTSWNGLPLPFDLTPIGMPGCSLLTRATLLLPFAASSGVANLSLQLRNDPTLVGGQFFSQGFVVDPSANPAGLSASNGGEATVGAR